MDIRKIHKEKHSLEEEVEALKVTEYICSQIGGLMIMRLQSNPFK